ncbi:phytol kinase [Rhodovulum iodosum]|uniref:Phytol kinase n=1 Tax=Rhodovulum iodosum TaxID=68291 RepID=A0ABV3XPC4_9RHOB|nr:hypothetical protein [Rhodovulum robiginosum]RSK31529.1 hypothetical protein EJA01_15470 [Rhodovulum robiginosum]
MNAPAAQIAAGLALLAGLFALLFALGRIGRRRGWPPELSRKTMHMATGLGALALPFVLRIDWAFYAILGIALAGLGLLRLPRLRAMGGALHGVARASYGEMFFVLSIGLLHLFAGGQPVLYVLPLAILTLGDAAAALVGGVYGRRMFRVEEGAKSIEGSVVFFLVSANLAMICLLLLTDIARENVILIGLMAALFGALVEADSWRGFDNLFLPIGLMIFLTTALAAPAADIAARMALFLGAWAGFAWLAPRLGADGHSVRVHIVAAFLILSATSSQNAVLPLAALFAHALTRRLSPTADRHPDLDMVAAIGLLSIFALAAGAGLGVNVLNFYALAAGSLAAALVALALEPFPALWRAIGGFAASAALFSAWLGVMALNGAGPGWHGELRPAGLALFLLATVLPAYRPHLFRRQRAFRLLALCAGPAAAICGILYVVGGRA